MEIEAKMDVGMTIKTTTKEASVNSMAEQVNRSPLTPQSKHKVTGPDGQIIRLVERNGAYYIPALTFGRLLTAYNPSGYIHRVYLDLRRLGLVSDDCNVMNANGNLFALCFDDALTIASHANKMGACAVKAWLEEIMK